MTVSVFLILAALAVPHRTSAAQNQFSYGRAS
jgi:hypothetical protein